MVGRIIIKTGISIILAAAIIVSVCLTTACNNDLLDNVKDKIEQDESSGDDGPAPDIVVKQDGTVITAGGDFSISSSVVAGETEDIVFTIENIGDLELNLTGSPNLVSLSSLTDFSVTEQPSTPVTPSSSTQFTVRFAPLSEGLKSVTVNIANDDDDESLYSFTINGTADAEPEPEINITMDSTDITSGGDIDGGGTVVGTPLDIDFVIENNGTAELNLTGSPNLVSLSSATDFSVSAQPSTPVATGDNTGFTVTFDPVSSGSKSVTVTINNDDPDEAPYTFTINAEATAAPEPEINLKQGSTSITSGGSFTGMGSVAAGSYSDVVFTIENLGTETLALEGSPNLVSLSSTTDFSVVAQPSASSITSGSSTSFTLRFSPQSGGSKSVTVTIPNNDSNEDPYTFTASGTGLVPEINVKQGVTSISSGGSKDVGSTAVGSPLDTVFTIENTGGADLSLTGSPYRVTLSSSTDFSVTVQPSATVSAGGTTTFTLRFNPASSGLKSVTIYIPNNDSNESTYTFTVTGTGLVPDINLKEGTDISNSSTYSFAETMLGETDTAVFTIENTGSADLVLTGSPYVQISGADSSMFTVTSQPSGTVSPSGSTTFTVEFTPSETGMQYVTMTIPNNDPDEGPFIIYPQGNATYWHGIQAVADLYETEGLFSSIKSYGDNVYISYSSYTGSAYKFQFSSSTDGGANWSTQTLSLPGTTGYRYQQMEVDGQNIFIAAKNSYSLYIIYSHDAGQTWGYRQCDSDTSLTGEVAITLDGTYVYIAYTLNGGYGIKLDRLPYSCSSESEYVVESLNRGYCLSLANDSSNVYLSCTDNSYDDLYFYKASKSNLSSWTKTTADDGGSDPVGESNSIEVYGSNVYISYIGSASRELLFARSSDGGTSWTTGTVDDSLGYYSSYDAGCYADLAIDGSSLYISYYNQEVSGFTYLYLAKSTNGGVTWSTSVVDDTIYNSGPFNAIDASGGNIFISYYQSYSPTYRDLYFAKSIDGGLSW